MFEFRYFLSHCLSVLFGWALRRLLPRGNRWINFQMVTDEFWIYSWGFISIPGKDINVPSKEFYQLFFLLMRQLGSNLKELFQIVLYSNFYQIFTLRILDWLIDG